jgi:hypothetical protein
MAGRATGLLLFPQLTRGNTMKIRSLIERKNGTVIPMDDAKYHFKPEVANGPPVADVTNKAHIARFLSIAEGFEVVEVDEATAASAPGLTDPDNAPAQPGQEQTQDEQNVDPVDALSAILNAGDADGIERGVAEAAFEHLFGRAPNAKAKTETIIGKIIEKAEEEGLMGTGE